jgi:molybdopterin-guanine dinucleotide biosynthesis protein A
VTLTAMLLVGGESRRMGRDKATLAVDGRPLWERQLALLKELQPHTVLLSARERPAWCPGDLDVVLDAAPSRGPLSGVVAALARLHTTHLLALAVDLPSITSALLRQLWLSAQPGWGVAPLGDHGFEATCAVYPAEAAPIATATLASPDPSLQKLLRELSRQQRVMPLPLHPSEKSLFRNLNTPADLELRSAECGLPTAKEARKN